MPKKSWPQFDELQTKALLLASVETRTRLALDAALFASMAVAFGSWMAPADAGEAPPTAMLPVVTMFCDPKLGLIFEPATAAPAATSASTSVAAAADQAPLETFARPVPVGLTTLASGSELVTSVPERLTARAAES